MARVLVPLTPLVGPYPVLPIAANALDLIETAADVSNFNSVAFGNASTILLFVHNTHASVTATFSIDSAIDNLNRTGDVVDYSLAAGESGVFACARNGWRQPSDGTLHIDASAATMKFAAIAI